MKWLAAASLSVLLSKLDRKVVAANPKRPCGKGGGFSGGEFSKLNKGKTLDSAKVWRRSVHVLGNIDIANCAIRLEGVAKKNLKIVSGTREIANDKGLDDLTAHRPLGCTRALQSGPGRTGRGRRGGHRSGWARDLAYQGWGSGPCGSGGGREGSDRGAAGSGLCLLKLCGLRPSEGAVANAPHDGVGIAEGGDGAEQAVKPVGALSKAKCGHGSHGISGVIGVRYYYVYGQPSSSPSPPFNFYSNLTYSRGYGTPLPSM